MTVPPLPKVAHISITNGGTLAWSIQFSQNVDPMKKNVLYEISFDAWASKDDAGDYSQLQFNLGDLGPYDFYLDNVSLTADNVEQIINGDFSSSITTGWNDLLLLEGGVATVTIITPPPEE